MLNDRAARPDSPDGFDDLPDDLPSFADELGVAVPASAADPAFAAADEADAALRDLADAAGAYPGGVPTDADEANNGDMPADADEPYPGDMPTDADEPYSSDESADADGAYNGDESADAEEPYPGDMPADADEPYNADGPADDAELDNPDDPADAEPEDADASWAKRLSTRFDGLTDEEIVAVAQGGDSVAFEFLLNKYKNFVRSKARSYFLIGADHEDIVQEGMIGLFKAIRDYQPDRLSSFRAFSELCITRQIITAIKTATRQKHVPLNSYVSLNKPIYDEESDRTLMDVIVEGHAQNPEELIIGREDIVSIRDRVDEVLSSLEQEVLTAYLDGKSYQEIAEMLGRHVKSIDNALQRVKRKLEKYLEESKAQEE